MRSLPSGVVQAIVAPVGTRVPGAYRIQVLLTYEINGTEVSVLGESPLMVTGAQDAKSVLITDTPVNRVKLERFGKSSVVLARCAAADQTKYEPLFRQASQILANYRAAMGIKRLVPRELAMLGPINPPAKPTPAAKKK